MEVLTEIVFPPPGGHSDPLPRYTETTPDAFTLTQSHTHCTLFLFIFTETPDAASSSFPLLVFLLHSWSWDWINIHVHQVQLCISSVISNQFLWNIPLYKHCNELNWISFYIVQQFSQSANQLVRVLGSEWLWPLPTELIRDLSRKDTLTGFPLQSVQSCVNMCCCLVCFRLSDDSDWVMKVNGRKQAVLWWQSAPSYNHILSLKFLWIAKQNVICVVMRRWVWLVSVCLPLPLQEWLLETCLLPLLAATDQLILNCSSQQGH